MASGEWRGARGEGRGALGRWGEARWGEARWEWVVGCSVDLGGTDRDHGSAGSPLLFAIVLRFGTTV